MLNEAAIGGEHRHPTVTSVGHDDVIQFISADALGPLHLSIIETPAAKLQQQGSSNAEHLDAVVSGVTDHNSVVPINDQKLGHAQLTVIAAVRPKRPNALAIRFVDPDL